MAGCVPESTRRMSVVAMTAVLLVAYSVNCEELKMEHREGHKGTCSPEETRHCTLLAEPLLRDPDLVFPDNMADIERVCRTWRQLVGCVGSFTGRCFSEDRQEAFQKGAGGALASVTALCTQSIYQKEYLGHAPCIKATLTQKDHCGMYYERMVANADPTHPANKANMCCAHHMFRECVIKKVKKNCDLSEDELKRLSESREHKWSKVNGRGPSFTSDLRSASQFAQQVLDQALNFIMDQCRQYILNSKDCEEDRSNLDRDVTRANKTTESLPLPPTASPTYKSPKIERVTTTTERSNPWPTERESKDKGFGGGVEGRVHDSKQDRDEVVKVVSAPKFAGSLEKSGSRSRSELGSGRSLDVNSESTSATAAWSSASAWGDNSSRHSDSSTRVSSLGKKHVSTTEPWYPSYYYGNTLEGAKQQGLSSGVKSSIYSQTLISNLMFFYLFKYLIP